MLTENFASDIIHNEIKIGKFSQNENLLSLSTLKNWFNESGYKG